MNFELHQCIGHRIRRLSRITDEVYRKWLADFDITENQMSILFVLHTMGEVEQGLIGNEMGLERSTVSRNIKLLEKKSLVTKTNDYRPKVALTKTGKEMTAELIPVWEKIMTELVEKLGSDGFKMIEDLENKLN